MAPLRRRKRLELQNRNRGLRLNEGIFRDSPLLFRPSLLGRFQFFGFRLPGRGFQFASQFERGVFNLLTNGTGPEALGTASNCLRGAVFRRRPDVLEVRQKRAARNSGDFRTDTAEILGLTAGLNMVSDCSALAADFTYACHEFQNLHSMIQFD